MKINTLLVSRRLLKKLMIIHYFRRCCKTVGSKLRRNHPSQKEHAKIGSQAESNNAWWGSGISGKSLSIRRSSRENNKPEMPREREKRDSFYPVTTSALKGVDLQPFVPSIKNDIRDHRLAHEARKLFTLLEILFGSLFGSTPSFFIPSYSWLNV